MKTNALDNSGPNAGNRSFDLLVAMGAHDERAARVSGRQQGVTVVKAMLELSADLNSLAKNPF